MAYLIQKTDGTTLTVIDDETIDNTTNLTLIGKNYTGFGDFLNENLVRLLENAANSTPPPKPLQGQLWWDKTNSSLKVYTGATFKTVSASTASPTSPANSSVGDLWWDTLNSQLKVYDGTLFTTIGPEFENGSGTKVETIYDNSNPPVAYKAIKVYLQDTPVAIISKAPTYQPNPAINGYASIKPGINLISSGVVPGIAYNGISEDSLKLGNVAASNYVRNDTNVTLSGTLSVTNNNGITVGAGSSTVGTYISSGSAIIQNNILNGNLLLRANVAGTVTSVLSVNGATGRIEVTGNPTTSMGIATKAYVDAAVSGTGNGNVSGPSSSTNTAVARFNGTSGKLIQNSVVTIGETGAIAGVSTLSATGNITTSGDLNLTGRNVRFRADFTSLATPGFNPDKSARAAFQSSQPGATIIHAVPGADVPVGNIATTFRVESNKSFTGQGPYGAFRMIQDTAVLIGSGADTITSPTLPIVFVVGPSETMRMHPEGIITMGTSDPYSNGAIGVKIYNNTSSPYISTVGSSTSSNNTAYNLYSTGAGAYRFYVGYNGTVYAANTSISAISDQRLKENIRDLDDGLNAVMALKPRKFDWKKGKGKDVKNDRGFVAQEFEQVFPDLVDNWKDESPAGEDPYKAVRQDLIPVLVKAIQEQQEQIEQLKAEVASLKGV